MNGLTLAFQTEFTRVWTVGRRCCQDYNSNYVSSTGGYPNSTRPELAWPTRLHRNPEMRISPYSVWIRFTWGEYFQSISGILVPLESVMSVFFFSFSFFLFFSRLRLHVSGKNSTFYTISPDNKQEVDWHIGKDSIISSENRGFALFLHYRHTGKSPFPFLWNQVLAELEQ